MDSLHEEEGAKHEEEEEGVMSSPLHKPICPTPFAGGCPRPAVWSH